MLRKDYILRQFEEFGKALALILGHKKNQDWESFEKELSEAAEHFASTSLPRLLALNYGDFEKEAVLNNSLNLEQKKILARLLSEKLDACFLRYDNRDAASLKQKCILLYSYLKNNATEHEYDLEVHYRLEPLNRLQIEDE